MELLLKDFSTGYSKNEVINKINFRLKQNEWIGIIGANGSGKSTLLKGVLKFIPTPVSYTHLTLPTKRIV